MGVGLREIGGHQVHDAHHGGVEVGVAGGEGGEAEAEIVRLAKVGDDCGVFDHGSDDPPPVGVPEGDVGTALVGLARGGELKAEWFEV